MQITDIEHRVVDIDQTRAHAYNQVNVRRLRSFVRFGPEPWIRLPLKKTVWPRLTSRGTGGQSRGKGLMWLSP